MHGGLIGRRQAARRLETWLDRAGIPHRGAHALRHTFATALYRRTGDVLIVKEALGHRSVASTLVYAQASEERLRRAMGSESALFVPAQGACNAQSELGEFLGAPKRAPQLGGVQRGRFHSSPSFASGQQTGPGTCS
ncbi:MAG: tyrosine-type recombinase/integrase [Planctomycetes bacterium]|nr:tyrosine-type recombinase/integrase [Planctomycetota bacterium]